MLSQEKLFYSESHSSWLSLGESKFLDPGILCQSDSLPCVLDVIHHLQLPLVNLPATYKVHLKLTRERLTELEFVKLFFDHLSQLSTIKESRNMVIMHMLEAYASHYDKHTELALLLEHRFANQACIPTAPDGSVLRKCEDIVDLEATFACLFDDSDHRFPLDMLAKRHLVVTALDQAGIMDSKLKWDLVIDRAQSVEGLMKRDKIKALKRVQLIIKTLSNAVAGKPPTSGTTIDTVKFLPVMKKPKGYPLPWYGESYTLLAGNQLMLSELYLYSESTRLERICGSQVAFLCEHLPKDGGCGYVNDKDTRNLLNLRSSPSAYEVISQLKNIIAQFNSSNPPQTEWITISCEEIYKFIETTLSKDELFYLKQLSKIACIWNGKEFLHVGSVALNWKLSNGPYLYTAPPSVASKAKLTKALGIKKNFTCDDAQRALENIKLRSGNKAIDKSCESLITEILSIFLDAPLDELKALKDKVYLPDTQNIVHKSCDLVFNDAVWAPIEKDSVEVSEKLTRELAVTLGVRLVSSRILEQYVSKKPKHFSGVPFGQHEELTTRIQDIITEYPFDETILKELLQNADDAKATKLYVVLDKRTHGKESVLSENWQELQGPALLVWNDSIFSEKDLEGIQLLGLGSKRSDADTIGQYGIGFNVVYHLTDCPSFITNGDTLCVLDPHLRYAPEAEVTLPGARYDSLKHGFWEKFNDMSSAYLQNHEDGLPKEFQKGSLFRFPIRHTSNMMKSSKIVDSSSQKPLSVDGLSQKVQEWMPKMKQAMFFLNYVAEIKYIEIGGSRDSCSIEIQSHFKAEIKSSSSFIQAFHDVVSDFTEPSTSRAGVIQYPLTITEISQSGNSEEEKWLIQQGVGDINNEDQHWPFINRMKPKHGIAAPMLPEEAFHNDKKRNGNLFCFLPLPLSSYVPVHINGFFILHSSRRSLWNPDGPDTRSRWNAYLFKAIASSYAEFLEQARSHYLKTAYDDWKQALIDLQNYYYLFPYVSSTDLDKKWSSLPCEVYKTLLQSNSKILCVLDSSNETFSVEWHPLFPEVKANQVYFWSSTLEHEHKIIHPVLQSIGMKVTSAPPIKMDCINRVIEKLRVDASQMESSVECDKIPSVSPSSVFEYYTKHSALSSSHGMLPCPIKRTPFQNVDTFLLFMKYLLEIRLADLPSRFTGAKSICSEDTVSIGTFPGSPFSHFLLLSADEILRRFDAKCKPLNSEYHQLFPAHKDKFLHPALREVNFNPSYFISSGDEEDNEIVALILSIFEGTLPHELQNRSVVLSGSKEEELSKYWNCFEDDKVLACFLPKILEHWALLLTTDNRLFSTDSEVLPSHLPLQPDEVTKNVVAIMRSLRIPFLNSAVVTAPVENIPELSDHDKILSYFYYTNQREPITSVLKDTTHINTLVRYFASDAKPTNEVWVRNVSSLPLFEDVAGNYLPVSDKKTFIWPVLACDVGYCSWASDRDVRFIKPESTWKQLGSAEQLKVCSISAEQLYSCYIFPAFAVLREEERYKHLDHIRQVIYPLARKKRHFDAESFIDNLIRLKCIGPDYSTLQPVSFFCDPNVEVFKEFSSDLGLEMLPLQLRTKDWLEFFKELGLKKTLTPVEYLDLCSKTAEGKVKKVRECSDMLIQYLFSKEIRKLWSKEHDFLGQVSRIAFVPTCNTSSIDWIVPGKNQSNQLVPLNGAASVNLMSLVWTVRPIINLPQHCFFPPHQRDEASTTLLEELNVMSKANVLEVVANIRKISNESPYSMKALFDNYPEQLVTPENGLSLLTVMMSNLDFLSNEEYQASQMLADLPCIPVYCDSSNEDERKMVLVKPSSTLANSHLAQKYHPYLYSIPAELRKLIPFLTEIGVKNDLELHHMQIVLEKIFNRSQGAELDPDARECVEKALEFLFSHLSTLPHNDAAKLSPLYLPDVNNVLKLSTTMLYGDTASYFGHVELDLTGTKYSHYDIIEDAYGVAALDLCRLLPKNIQPLGMSVMCKQAPNEDCISVDHSEYSRRVEEMLQHAMNPHAFVNIYKKFVSSKTSSEDLEHLVEEFFSSITVVTKQNFGSQIILRESNQVIGHMKSFFYFESQEMPRTLYISEQFDDDDDVATEIIEHLYENISQTFPAEVNASTKFKLLNFMTKFLKAKPSKKHEILDRYHIKFSFVLGEAIPGYYHSRLDQHPHNVFLPMEYVGYEDKDDHIIVAQVIHLVEAEGANILTARYHCHLHSQE
jgi:sacsin